MMKNNTLGFFQTWNKEANKPEFSITRLQMAVMTVFTIVFTFWFYIGKERTVTFENICLVLILLIGCYTPKALKDLIEKLRDRRKV